MMCKVDIISTGHTEGHNTKLVAKSAIEKGDISKNSSLFKKGDKERGMIRRMV